MKKQRVIAFFLTLIGCIVTVSSQDANAIRYFLDTTYIWEYRTSQFFVAFPNFLMGIIIAISGVILFFIPNFLDID